LIFEKITVSYHHKLPFVCFKKPNASKLKAYFGEDASLNYSTSFEEEGFIFAPFHNENKSIVFLNNAFEVIEEKFNIPSIINVTITPSVLGKGYLNKRTLLSVSSCGICGKQQLEDIKVSGDKIEKKSKFFL